MVAHVGTTEERVFFKSLNSSASGLNREADLFTDLTRNTVPYYSVKIIQLSNYTQVLFRTTIGLIVVCPEFQYTMYNDNRN